MSDTCPKCGTAWSPWDTPNPDREILNAHCHQVATLRAELAEARDIARELAELLRKRRSDSGGLCDCWRCEHGDTQAPYGPCEVGEKWDKREVAALARYDKTIGANYEQAQGKIPGQVRT